MKKLIIASVASICLMGCHEKKVEYFEDGKTVRLEYEVDGDGKVDGQFKHYYRNGNVEFLGEFKNGFPKGVGTIFDENGTVKNKVTYKYDYMYLIQDKFTDPRDNKVYPIAKIGKQVWLAQNLSYEIEGSLCMEKDGYTCKHGYEEFGRHYTWEAAMKACPDGWHLPNNDEWNELFEYVAGVSEQVVLEKLMYLDGVGGGSSTCYKPTFGSGKMNCLHNPYGFNLRFAGAYENGKLDNVYEWTMLWSASKLKNNVVSMVYAFSPNLDEDYQDIKLGVAKLDEKPAFSVRCIKGEPNYALEETVTSGVSSAAPNKDIGEEIISNFNMYTKLQDACFENFEEVCSLAKTGFTLPSSKAFKFGEMNNPMGIYATIKTAQASCPKGGKWEIYAEKKGKTLKYKCKVNAGCESLTSRLKKICEVSVK